MIIPHDLCTDDADLLSQPNRGTTGILLCWISTTVGAYNNSEQIHNVKTFFWP